jgi:3-deoxy-manno-octulosonate cytidylyltransferase (CMP-KDO synthetase)
MEILGVIPARMASQRLPGKPLAPLAGKPMVQHVWERVKAAASITRVVIATDDERVCDAAKSFGADAMMTPADCPSGTDRAALVAQANPQAKIVVNIQGDEPLIDPGVIDRCIGALLGAPWAAVSTPMTPIRDRESFESPHIVKVAHTPEGRALYFSRSPIPSRARSEPAAGEPWGMKHLGLYTFRREALLDFATWPPALLETMEKLEQLRFLAHGCGIAVVETPHDSVGVDTPEDLERVERRLRGEE